METQSRLVQSIVVLFFLVTFFSSLVRAGEPEVSDVLVTDVSTHSFSVIWKASEASVPGLQVYADEQGLVPVADVALALQPVTSGDETIQEQAEDNGVMKVTATALVPGMVYYFQTFTTSKKSSSETVYFPADPPFLPVTTEMRVTRTEISEDIVLPFTNDLIRFDCFLPEGTLPATGTLLVAEVAGGSYPVSGFVGDGVPLPYAYVDLNNLFDSLSNESMSLKGGEQLTLTQFMGIDGMETVVYSVPENLQLTELKEPSVSFTCNWDFDYDGDVDGGDLKEMVENWAAYTSKDCASFAQEFGSNACMDNPP
jgi:hypothetical protein